MFGHKRTDARTKGQRMDPDLRSEWTQPSRETAKAMHPAGSSQGSPAEQLERVALGAVFDYFDQAPGAREASGRGL